MVLGGLGTQGLLDMLVAPVMSRMMPRTFFLLGRALPWRSWTQHAGTMPVIKNGILWNALAVSRIRSLQIILPQAGLCGASLANAIHLQSNRVFDDQHRDWGREPRTLFPKRCHGRPSEEGWLIAKRPSRCLSAKRSLSRGEGSSIDQADALASSLRFSGRDCVRLRGSILRSDLGEGIRRECLV